ncbi:helix-turn-helix domain-containing protein [Nocardiopsis sp. NPDC006938]|uniref:helix-turn-helix domain-containing protein n=1 Tax=Nocardiopsis sp. NPDC006938 TaxID=3364337 RepID=UPI0036CAF682
MSERQRPTNSYREQVPERLSSTYDASSSGESAPLELFTPAQAAEKLKVPESWLRKKATARQVPFTFIGKHLRFSAQDLAQIIHDGRREPLTGPSSRPRRRTE